MLAPAVTVTATASANDQRIVKRTLRSANVVKPM